MRPYTYEEFATSLGLDPLKVRQALLKRLSINERVATSQPAPRADRPATSGQESSQ